VVNSSEDPVLALARRLRALRERGLANRLITQGQLALALSGRERASVPLISSWERATQPTVLSQSRIEAYATFFATERSLDHEPYRLIDLDDLTTQEKARYDELLDELTHLRNEAVRYQGSPARVFDSLESGLWHFPIDEDITIFCPELPDDLRQKMSPYTNPNSPDYVKLYQYADPDALLELYGHIRAVNPANRVTIRTPAELIVDAYTAHLVVLGDVDWNPVVRDLFRRIDIPIRQVGGDDQNPSSRFEIGTSGQVRVLRPTIRELNGEEVLLEDVAHFYRGPNPFNMKRTVTMCSGTSGRGTLGAVRALTDPRFRSRNEEYIKQHFSRSDKFSIVSRVYMVSGEVVTPDWTLPDIRLHEWPSEDEGIPA
jgi:hypothetical protein